MAEGRKLGDKAIAALAARAAGDARALAAVAGLAAKEGLAERAYGLAREARRLAPEDAAVRALTEGAVGWSVPAWHFRIVRDEVRNAAYEAALRRAVGPETRVLEIGAGTGLLSMMAARAGAAEVVACEMNLAVADAAARVVAANGLAGRVRIVPKKSQDLDPEADLGGPADLLLSEIVSNDMLREGVLPAMEDAAARLLKPGGRMIPALGAVRVALAWWEDLAAQGAGQAAGVDLTAFDSLIRLPLHVKSDDASLALRSEAADLMLFDFASGGPFPPQQAEAVLVAQGEANGIVQWIRLELDAGTAYENSPGCGFQSCWACLFTPLLRPAAAGETVRVHGSHDRLLLRIWGEA